MVDYYDPGDSVTVSVPGASASPNKPRWLTWASAAGNLTGTASLPSGFRRWAVGEGRNGTGSYTVKETAVNPPSLPADPGTPWRCIIYASDGHYIVMDGLPGTVPTVGTPRVRLTDNGPSKAVVRIPVTAGVLSPSYSGWDDGHAEAVSRGMEMTVEYRTPDGTLTLAFRGRIFEAEAGEYVTLTAYDRLMDLSLFSDQYTPSAASYVENEVSYSRTSSGDDYVYTMGSEVGQVAAAYPIDKLSIDTLASQGTGAGFYPLLHGDDVRILHSLPVYGSYTALEGRRIYRMEAKFAWDSLNTAQDIRVWFYLYSVTGGSRTYLYSWIGDYYNGVSSDHINTGGHGSGSFTASVSIDGGVEVPANCYIGVSWDEPVDSGYIGVCGVKTASRVAHEYIIRVNGTWSLWDVGEEGGPEIAVQFSWFDFETPIESSVSVSGSSVSVPSAMIPSISSGPVTTADAGIGILLTYQSLDAISVRDIVEGMIRGAGMDPSVSSDLALGLTTYYTSSTYAYLDCIHDLVRSADAGLRDTLALPGRVAVLPRHTDLDTPAASFSTDPMDGDEQSIVSYSLTSRWAAEKATVAILAENVTSSGLPIALETDDWLMRGSLVDAIGSPMRGVTADRSSGTHALLANQAAGEVRRLHTNVVEGTVTLAGYRPDIWELDGATHEGGIPVSLTVPEYGIEDTVAVPTEMEIGDGVTVVTLDNIRRADRSEVANSMVLTADAISNGSGELPDTVWMFGRADMGYLQYAGQAEPSSVTLRLYTTAGALAKEVSSAYTKIVTDSAGYLHVVGVVPGESPGIATGDPVAVVAVVIDGAARETCAALDVPKNVLANQAAHIDLRFRAA